MCIEWMKNYLKRIMFSMDYIAQKWKLESWKTCGPLGIRGWKMFSSNLLNYHMFSVFLVAVANRSLSYKIKRWMYYKSYFPSLGNYPEAAEWRQSYPELSPHQITQCLHYMLNPLIWDASLVRLFWRSDI